MSGGELIAAAKAFAKAHKKSEEFAERRRALPAGASRARVTTANARWSRWAEERDRCAVVLEQLRRNAPDGPETEKADAIARGQPFSAEVMAKFIDSLGGGR